MNDRLADLGVSARELPASGTTNAVVTDEAISTMEEGREVKIKNSNMDQFFVVVESIKADISAIRDATQEIGEINEDAILAHTQDEERSLSARLQPLVSSTNKRAKHAKALLDVIKKQNASDKESKKKSVSASDMRVRENLNNTLTRRFVDEMKAYQNAQQKYKSDIKKKVKRQVQIVKPDATDEEIDAVMKSEGGQEALYKEKILKGAADPIK